MDDGFPAEWQSDLFWLEDIPISNSAFVPYADGPTHAGTARSNLSCGNVNKRMMEFLGKSCPEERVSAAGAGTGAGGDLKREKSFRHMMNERVRREKQKQSYFALHSMLPKGTKNDKNSMVQMATRAIQELKSYEEKLRRRNSELEKKLALKGEREEGTVIRLRVDNPSSGINSILEVLNVLKTWGVNARAIHTTFTDSVFSALLVIDTQLAAAEVERALQMRLSEVERKFRGEWQEDCKW